ncbi:uncharacterized protein RCC_08965 [Ramularia collo-cygni]|uniref:Tyrosinase copper-binding domain-containing protein n=1 Tax=Ramularia collo-cygni TaxID=112498 RepID=A0A2D3VL88_9PEZI|nr:uncharacterized protein RCC_08965 [Ramularia collo-cygni]CZT23254.1 uncharacterized protein RCC_08965 [Ramularia collo-cygni]
MSAQERTAFISALKCMNTAPSRSPRGLDNNARNRWDDFTIAHNINTPTIHWSGLLMPWHRHYLSVLETTLRTECNYAGSLPYWDYAKYLSLPLSSNPLFDGSATSLGSTGHGPGNCITDGPLTDFVVNMPPPDPSSSARQKNPRCIKRNLSPNSVLAQYVSYERMTSVIRDSEDIVAFHQGLEGPDGLHPQPHTWVGGLQNNIYLAAQDPWFFLHHAMIDRVWVMWQMGDWEGRKGALDAGSWFVDRERLEFGALPPATLDTTLYLSPIFQNVTIREAMNPTGGALCYMYD